MASPPTYSTALVLQNWEKQSTAAERLAADVLRLEGFSGIDPQSPLGGPDGGKDILCAKEGVEFVAACYFPTGDQDFGQVERKFGSDLGSAHKHERDGFIFITNQRLTPGERTTLELAASAAGKRCLIYHREYLRVVLDSPSGYGVRLKHLGIPLSTEEQFAYFATRDAGMSSALAEHTRAIETLVRQVDALGRRTGEMLAHSAAVIIDEFRRDVDPVDAAQMLKASVSFDISRPNSSVGERLSSNLTVGLLCYIHRKVMPPGTPHGGRFRQTQVWLADHTGKVVGHFDPPTWDRVPTLVSELLSDWNRNVEGLSASAPGTVVAAIGAFAHRLLQIHPFIDGNGRLAREFIDLMARDWFGLERGLLLDAGAPFYLALQTADGGDLHPLSELILAAVQEAGSDPSEAHVEAKNTGGN